MPAGGDIEVRVAIGLMLRKGLQDSVVRKMVEASRRDVVPTSHTACSEPLCPVLFLESIAKRMIKYLLFARSHEIWQREIL